MPAIQSSTVDRCAMAGVETCRFWVPSELYPLRYGQIHSSDRQL